MNKTKLIECQFKQISISTPFFHNYLKSPKNFLYTIDRKKLGQWQLSKIKNKIKLRKNAKVTTITKDYILVNSKEKKTF